MAVTKKGSAMEAALSIFKLSFLLSLLSGGSDFIDSRSHPDKLGRPHRRASKQSVRVTSWSTPVMATRFTATPPLFGFLPNQFRVPLLTMLQEPVGTNCLIT